MSNLLEEAIIDANALRETALKSAENALIEKYKEEFKKSVNKLLEQDESTGIPPPESMSATDTAVDSTLVGGENQVEAGGEALKDVPSSFLDGDDDELITIDFDQLEKQISDILGSPVLASPEEAEQEQPSDQEIEQPEVQQLEEDLELTEESSEDEEEDSEEDLEVKDINKNGKKDGWEVARAKAIAKSKNELDEELELELEEAYDQSNDEGLNIDALTEEAGQEKISSIENMIKQLQTMLAAAKAEQAASKTVDTTPTTPSASTTGLEEDFEITEQEIQELAEEMKVDIEVEGLLDGHMGTHQGEKREIRNMELAAARDECAEDDREEEQEKLTDLKNELNESRSQNKKYSNLIEELKDNLIVLKEQTEKLSISNAKLLYINKVFANNSLNERQKQNIVESISKTSTVLEAKTIFETLQSTVEGFSNKKSKESLSEALNRGNTVFSVRPKINQEEYTYSDRFKILAGIK